MLRRLREGEKYPGRDFNRIVDAAEQMLERSESVPAVGPGKNPALIRVKNLSGENVPSFGVLRITGRLFPNAENPVTSALNGGVELKGEKPNEDDDQIVCITQEAIPDNALGRAVLWAATGVKVNVTDATHTHAKPIADDTRKLESTDSGAWRIVEKPDGTGEMFCYVCPAGGGGGGRGTVFPVVLEQSSGLSGTSITQCTFKYYVQEVYTLLWWTEEGWGEIENRIEVDVGKWKRTLVGKYVKADAGLAYIQNSSLVISWINETEYVEVCV